MSAERLQKVLAGAGVASRRQVEQWIRAGRLEVNGRPAQLGTRIAAADRVTLDGRVVRLPQRTGAAALYVLHRSPGEPLGHRPVAAGERDPLLARLPRRAGRRWVFISPMPRGDGGLELATPDGELASRLQRAVRGWEADYQVRVRGALTSAQAAAVRLGQRHPDAPLTVLAFEPNVPTATDAVNRWYTLTTRGASGREVRGLLERCGIEVARIERSRLGDIVLPRDLPRGRYRRIDAAVVERLLSRARLSVQAAPGDAARSGAQQPKKGRG
ncbi:MAG: S4 domain-containing protein [Steroidobacteraceae bacterium]|nr:S4 domain-containing protein [Steroidobacteraceae bacterium]MDW8260587.1 S4 domain-containing protein [Gammaproteobacteria bacterium]